MGAKLFSVWAAWSKGSTLLRAALQRLEELTKVSSQGDLASDTSLLSKLDAEVTDIINRWKNEFIGKRREASRTRSRSRSQSRSPEAGLPAAVLQAKDSPQPIEMKVEVEAAALGKCDEVQDVIAKNSQRTLQAHSLKTSETFVDLRHQTRATQRPRAQSVKRRSSTRRSVMRKAMWSGEIHLLDDEFLRLGACLPAGLPILRAAVCCLEVPTVMQRWHLRINLQVGHEGAAA